MSNSDYKKPFIDLSKLLAPASKTKTNMTLIKNLFNRFLTKEESQPLYGYVGDAVTEKPKPYIIEPSFERDLNSLQPCVYTKIGAEDYIVTFSDVLRKLELLGVETKYFGTWGAAQSFNFAPPIDLDKFSNFAQYRWYGHLVDPLFISRPHAWNPNLEKPEFYVIEKPYSDPAAVSIIDGSVVTEITIINSGSNFTVAPSIEFISSDDGVIPAVAHTVITDGRISQIVITDPGSGYITAPIIKFTNIVMDIENGDISDWTYFNYWAHADDIAALGYEINLTIQALRPIIEYEYGVELAKISPDENLPVPPPKRIADPIRAISNIGNGICIPNPANDEILDPLTIMETWTFTAISPVLFSVIGSKSGFIGNADTNTDCTLINYYVFSIPVGTIPFQIGDHFTITLTQDLSLYQEKNLFNQPPLFNLYNLDESFSYKISSLFYYNESQLSPVDDLLERRLVTDINSEFKFKQGMTDLQTEQQYFYRKNGAIKSIWAPGNFDHPKYFTKLNLSNVEVSPLKAWVIGNVAATLNIVTDVNDKFYISVDSGTPLLITIPYVLPYYLDLESLTIEIQSRINSLLPIGKSVNVTIVDKDKICITSNNENIDSSIVLSESITNNGLIDLFGDEIKSSKTADCAWKNPSQFFHNIKHENRQEMVFNDILPHFMSILSAQDGFTGSPFGRNNYHLLGSPGNAYPEPNVGLGGKIRDYNSGFDLFLGLMNQRDITVPSIISFAEMQYRQSLNSISEFINQNIVLHLTNGVLGERDIENLSYNDPVIESLYHQYEILTAGRADLKNVYLDSTSAIPNWPATLPYLGLLLDPLNTSIARKVNPGFKFDLELGINVLVHHDGHLSPLVLADINKMHDLVKTMILRSDNTTTMGLFETSIPIPNTLASWYENDGDIWDRVQPYKNQLGYNSLNNKIYYFAVKSDSEPPLDLAHGDLWYKRDINILYKFNAFSLPNPSWEQQPKTDASWIACWKIFNYEQITNALFLNVEKKLYAGIQPRQPLLYDLTGVSDSERLQEELAIFSSTFGYDTFSSVFNPEDAFTWNYSQAIIPESVLPGAPAIPAHATWQELYREYFGTVRPNLEPWVLVNLSRTDFIILLGSESVLGTQAMWNAVVFNPTWINKNKKLPVNILTNELYPPYMAISALNGEKALLNEIPNGIQDDYVYGDKGPIELIWTKSLEYSYSILRTAFRLDPIKFTSSTWGKNGGYINEYEVDRSAGRRMTFKEFKLHGEEIVNPAIRDPDKLFLNLVIDSYSPCRFTFKEYTQTSEGGVFKAYFQDTGPYSDGTILELPYLKIGLHYMAPLISCTLFSGGRDFELRDEIVINWPGPILNAKAIITFTPAKYKLFNGLNQIYTNILRYNSLDIGTAFNTSLLRDWEPKLGYRTSGLINTETLKIQTDLFKIGGSLYNVYLKTNPAITDTWLNALRIQLVRPNTRVAVPASFIPSPDGTVVTATGECEDWIFRVETYNPNYPILEYYELDTSAGAPFVTFNSLSKKTCPVDWKIYTTLGIKKEMIMPVTIRGVQNTLNFLYGYIARLAEDGWIFNDSENPNVDQETGRNIDWQLEVEKFINELYLGVKAGSGLILNPFYKSVWLDTPRGQVSTLKTPAYIDANSSQIIYDVLGGKISSGNLRILREDQRTELVSNIPMASAHILIDEYEHIIIFENYQSETELIYDPFLGLRTVRVLVDGDRQLEFNGRLSYGGHYVDKSMVRKNIEASIGDMLNYYDTESVGVNSPKSRRARSLFGYFQKDYMTNIEIPEKSQFNFWRGLVHNKGSNNSINAFLNSAKFVSAALDEYWAYKIAEYGDSRTKEYPEIKLNVADCERAFTKLHFIETETSPVYPGFIGIPTDRGVEAEKRWFTLDDIGTHLYFDAELLDIVSIPFSSHGVPQETDFQIKYAYIIPNSPLSTSASITINSDHTFTVNNLTGGWTIATVYLYGVPRPKFSPAKLIDYKTSTSVSNIVIWDPAAGLHNPAALEDIDIISPSDIAFYNNSTQTIGNPNYNPLKPWGSREVGNTWWDDSNLDYLSYSDPRKYPLVEDQLARWGSLSNWSTVDIYEWVESKVSPSEYDAIALIEEGDAGIPQEQRASGQAARKQLFFRDRSWKQRPVAWKYTSAPPALPALQYSGVSSLILSDSTYGVGRIALLDSGTFETEGITTGMGFGAWTGDDFTGTPSGHGFFPISPISYIVGHEDPSLAFNTNFGSTYYFGSGDGHYQNISVTLSSTNPENAYLSVGSIIFNHEEINSTTVYVRATVNSTVPEYNGRNQAVLVNVPLFANERIVFDFDELGIELSADRKTNDLTWATATSHGDTKQQATGKEFGIYSTANNIITAKVREGMTATVAIEIPADLDGVLQTGDWRAWKEPTPADLQNDFISPNNRWLPVYGDWVFAEIPTLNPALIADPLSPLTAYPITTSNGGIVINTKSEWGIWKSQTDVKMSNRHLIANDSEFIIEEIPFDSTRLEVYIDGISTSNYATEIIIVNTTTYRGSLITDNSLNNMTKVTISETLRIGAEVDIFYRHYIPSATELAFDPDVEDDTTIGRNYKNNYNYVSKNLLDTYGNISSTLYYFWVQNKTFASSGRKMSIKLAASLIKAPSIPYIALVDIDLPDTSWTPNVDILNETNLLGPRYTKTAIYNLNRYVTIDDEYKLRFTRDFTLRENPEGLNLKNVHTEWALIRQHQNIKIPEQLWIKLTDTLAGFNTIGSNLPSLERINYDLRHGTFTRYGFGTDQVLVDQSVAIISVINTILNTTLIKRINHVEVPDSIMFLGDLSNNSEWFNTPFNTRRTMGIIWDKCKPKQINEIFFNVLNDALSNNYELTDIFKTSLLSAYSIRLLNIDGTAV